MFNGCVLLDVIADKVSEMTWDAGRLHYLLNVSVVKLVVGCGVQHQHVVTCTPIQEGCHYMIGSQNLYRFDEKVKRTKNTMTHTRNATVQFCFDGPPEHLVDQYRRAWS